MIIDTVTVGLRVAGWVIGHGCPSALQPMAVAEVVLPSALQYRNVERPGGTWLYAGLNCTGQEIRVGLQAPDLLTGT
jgi:hypothetical protein